MVLAAATEPVEEVARRQDGQFVRSARTCASPETRYARVEPRRQAGGIGIGGILGIAGIVIAILWSFWIGLIVALIGLIAFGGFVRGKWY